MTICIPYKSNNIGLSALLCMLQPQLKQNDAIYIVDNSDNGSGVMIAQMYGSSKMPILIEKAKFSIYESWNAGIDFAIQNSDNSVLFLNDDVVISQTLISNLKRSLLMSNYACIVPTTPDRAHTSRRLDTNFQWFNKYLTEFDVVQSNWMCGFAFLIRTDFFKQTGKFDTGYKVWFGDTEMEDRLAGSIGRMTFEYVYHFGGNSYNYSDPEVQKIISQDRERYGMAQKNKSIG